MSNKTNTKTVGAAVQSPKVLGVLAPTGNPETVDALASTPRYYAGPMAGKSGEVQVAGYLQTRKGELTVQLIDGANRVKLGTLAKIGNHYEGKLGNDTEVGAFIRQLSADSRKSGLRIVVMPLSEMRAAQPNAAQTERKTVSLADAVEELGDLTGQRQQKSVAMDCVPF